MNKHIRSATLLLIAALTPVSVSAELIFSDVEYTAFTSATTQLLPEVTDFDSKTVPIFSPASVQALSQPTVFSMGFPNIPNSVGSAFASAAQLTLGLSVLTGVGVNGFFFENSLPPNALVASTTFSQTLTNNSTTETRFPIAGFFVPTPTMQFFGVGNFFPPGVDPARDAFASVEARAITKITHPNGSIVENIVFDYGMRTLRSPPPGLPGSGVFMVVPLSPQSVGITRFDAPDGSFGFRLPELSVGINLELGPGDIMEVSFDYFATASTGFGETGIFAAIGDPFNLSTGGGRFDLQVGDPGPGVPVPEPATWTLLASGLLALTFGTRLLHARMKQ